MNELYKKRSDLILDYISQILVYGSNTNGSISINENNFEDGKYIILTVSVIKNNYFRWHDLGIKIEERLEFYKILIKNILEKFTEFNITFTDNSILISSSVNNNTIDISFTLSNKRIKDWFAKEKENFYNEIK